MSLRHLDTPVGIFVSGLVLFQLIGSQEDLATASELAGVSLK